MIDHDLLQTTLLRWKLPCDTRQLALYGAYIALLVEWNQRMNLVADSTLADPTRRHLLDSLVLATAVADVPESLADVGAGAGLPGIPLAILRCNWAGRGLVVTAAFHCLTAAPG